MQKKESRRTACFPFCFFYDFGFCLCSFFRQWAQRLQLSQPVQPLDKVKAHIRNGGAAVQPALRFHLADNVLQHLLLVAIQLQLLQDQRVPLNGLGSGKAYRQPGERSVVLNQVDYGVNTPVPGRSVTSVFG